MRDGVTHVATEWSEHVFADSPSAVSSTWCAVIVYMDARIGGAGSIPVRVDIVDFELVRSRSPLVVR